MFLPQANECKRGCLESNISGSLFYFVGFDFVVQFIFVKADQLKTR